MSLLFKIQLRNILLTAFIFITTFCTFSQKQINSDSLLNILDISKDDTSKVKALSKLSLFYLDRDIDKAFFYAKQAENLAVNSKNGFSLALAYNTCGTYYRIKNNFLISQNYFNKALEIADLIKNYKLIAMNYGDIGNLFSAKGDYNSAIKYLKNAIKNFEYVNDYIGVAKCELGIGVVLTKQGNYLEALQYYYKALKISEKYKYYTIQSRCLLNISVVLSTQGDNKQALKYLDKTINICAKNNDKRGLAAAYNNYASFYHGNDSIEKAIEYYKIALDLKNKLNDQIGVALILNNIGSIYFSKNKFEQALKYFMQSIDTAKKINDKYNLCLYLNSAAGVFNKQNNYIKSLEFYKKSIAIAEEIGSKKNLMDAYLSASEIFLLSENYKDAFTFFKNYSIIKDSLFNSDKTKKIEELHIKYETEKNEKELIIKNQENELLHNKNHLAAIQKTILITALILLFFISFFIVQYLRRKIKIDKQLKEAKENLFNIQIKQSESEKMFLQKELDYKSKELVDLALHISENNDFLENLKTSLSTNTKLFKAKDIVDLIEQHSQVILREREKFDAIANEWGAKFFNDLRKNNCELSKNEERMLVFLRLNLSSKEIASVLNVSPRTVDNMRYNLRKKLNLKPEESFDSFFNKI